MASVTQPAPISILDKANPVDEPIDAFLDRLLKKLREEHSSPFGAGLKAVDIDRLIGLAKDALAKQRTLIDVLPPITVCGDIHGQYNDLVHLFRICGWPPATRYLFLGKWFGLDYVPFLQTVLV